MSNNLLLNTSIQLQFLLVLIDSACRARFPDEHQRYIKSLSQVKIKLCLKMLRVYILEVRSRGTLSNIRKNDTKHLTFKVQ